MPHGQPRKGKEPRKQPGHTFKRRKHLHAREHQDDLAAAISSADETMCIDGRNAATHTPAAHPVHDAVESA
jgi:hypothetical protein